MEGTLAFEHRGRRFSETELSEAVELVRICRGLSRNELARTICEHLNWVTMTGSHKVAACMSLLEQLERAGRLQLPAKQVQHRSPSVRQEWSAETREQAPLRMGLGELGRVSLVRVHGRDDNALFNEFIARYHPLGYKRPYGCALRYQILSSQGQLGCILMSGAARVIEVRDQYIGWTDKQRQRHLPFVLNNSRYLIFPWVEVKHLASHVLGQLARCVRADFGLEFGYSPLMMETFVDPAVHEGTCYRAAGWERLGLTKGVGIGRPGRAYKTVPRLVYVKPLVRDFREQLCSEQLNGRIFDEEEDQS